jgi:hypothetical protein
MMTWIRLHFYSVSFALCLSSLKLSIKGLEKTRIKMNVMMSHTHTYKNNGNNNDQKKDT